MGSGNLGNAASHSSDRGLPPLPSASLLSEGREASGQAQAELKSRRQFTEAPQLDPGMFLYFCPFVQSSAPAASERCRPFCCKNVVLMYASAYCC